MSKKMKFKPEITRVRLNPEQAVLACTCYSGGLRWDVGNLGRRWGDSDQLYTACWPTRSIAMIRRCEKDFGTGGRYQIVGSTPST